MTKGEFSVLLNKIQEEERLVRAQGQQEYAHKDLNAFDNFERLSNELGISREKVLWIYLKKHLDGILAWINGHRSQRESVQGRIKDARMYLALLRGIAEELEQPDEELNVDDFVSRLNRGFKKQKIEQERVYTTISELNNDPDPFTGLGKSTGQIDFDVCYTNRPDKVQSEQSCSSECGCGIPSTKSIPIYVNGILFLVKSPLSYSGGVVIGLWGYGDSVAYRTRLGLVGILSEGADLELEKGMSFTTINTGGA
jgi:hypothetical protein